MEPLTHSSPGLTVASWIDRRRWAIVIASVILGAIGGWLASGLQIKAEFAALLPPEVQSVKNLRRIENRARAFGSLYVVVESDDPAERKRVAAELFKRLQGVDPALTTNVRMDNRELTRFMWKHRFMYASVKDLTDARDALAEKIKQAKLDANPLFVDFDDKPKKKQSESPRLAKLRGELDKAAKEAKEPTPWVATDGKLQVIALRASFAASKMKQGSLLLAQVRKIVAEVKKTAAPGLRIGLTGDVATVSLEQNSILRGLLIAASVTFLLVMVLLLIYFRSPLVVAAHLFSLAVGTLLTFGLTRLAIGHLNIATAFLGAIVVGNGINTGLILLSRYFEEIRRSDDPVGALGRSLAGASRGTLAAALTASIAYVSLIVTDFRGFRHFGIIAGTGMVLCWVTAFTVLPALLCILQRQGRIKKVREPALGPLIARLFPRRRAVPIAVCGVLSVLCVVGTVRYVASNPLETDWRNLRSSNAEIAAARRLNTEMSARVPNSPHRGNSGRFAIALPSRDMARTVASSLRAQDKPAAGEQKLFDSVIGYDDLLPTKQTEKLALLPQIRKRVDEIAKEDLDEAEKRRLDQITPDASPKPLTADSLPERLVWAFVERDGTRGRLVFVTLNPDRFNMWNVRDLVDASRIVRELDLPPEAVVGGEAFVFADMLRSMERDGPLASIVAFIGAVLAILLLMGITRYAWVTVACVVMGTAGMIALAAVADIKVNFLDFIAVPITIGIGIDYAVNMAARAKEGTTDARELLSTTGGAVLLCSLTTIIGYGSLLLADNAGIRSFGLAAILGEFACIVAALVLVPMLLCRTTDGSGASSAAASS